MTPTPKVGDLVQLMNAGRLYELVFVTSVNARTEDLGDNISVTAWDDQAYVWVGVDAVQHVSQNKNNYWRYPE